MNHKSRDKLNCRRKNLKPSTHSANARTNSGFAASRSSKRGPTRVSTKVLTGPNKKRHRHRSWYRHRNKEGVENWYNRLAQTHRPESVYTVDSLTLYGVSRPVAGIQVDLPTGLSSSVLTGFDSLHRCCTTSWRATFNSDTMLRYIIPQSPPGDHVCEVIIPFFHHRLDPVPVSVPFLVLSSTYLVHTFLWTSFDSGNDANPGIIDWFSASLSRRHAPHQHHHDAEKEEKT